MEEEWDAPSPLLSFNGHCTAMPFPLKCVFMCLLLALNSSWQVVFQTRRRSERKSSGHSLLVQRGKREARVDKKNKKQNSIFIKRTENRRKNLVLANLKAEAEEVEEVSTTALCSNNKWRHFSAYYPPKSYHIIPP